MKRLLMPFAGALLLTISASAFADTFESAIEFKEIKQQHHADWLKFVSEKEKEKNDLISEQMKDWSSLGIAHIKEIKNLQPGQQESFVKTMLEKSTALYEKHCKKMMEFWTKKNEQGKALFEKHMKQFNEFLKKAGMLKEKPEAKTPAESKEEMQNTVPVTQPAK